MKAKTWQLTSNLLTTTVLYDEFVFALSEVLGPHLRDASYDLWNLIDYSVIYLQVSLFLSLDNLRSLFC